MDVFRGEILAACQPSSLTKWPKCRSDSYFWIRKFKIKDHFHIKIFCQADRLLGLHF